MAVNVASSNRPLIAVCVCTFKRPRQLDQLLRCLDVQATRNLFTYSILVVDNDAAQSARGVVESSAKRLSVQVVYEVEPQQSIALARNASVRKATGELLAFVDDDEEPSADWLLRLYEVLVEHGVDGVLGPVIPTFDEGAPKWAVKGQDLPSAGLRDGAGHPLDSGGHRQRARQTGGPAGTRRALPAAVRGWRRRQRSLS